jgi:hypothetical protein
MQASCTPVAIQVEESRATDSKHYLLRKDDCRILWQLQFFQERKGFGIREEVSCTLPIAEQTALRRTLLERVANDTDQLRGMRNFVWGGVQNRELYLPRLASALAASGQWDAKRGMVHGKAAKDAKFMPDLMNRQNVFAELAESFAGRGLQLTVLDVETLQVGASPAPGLVGKYPVDCTLVFSLPPQKHD